MPHVQVVDLLSKSHLFRRLRVSDLEVLSDECREEAMAAGDVVYREGETARGVYLITRGRLKTTRRIQEEEQSFGCLQAGDVFGLESLLHDARRLSTVEAIEPCTLERIEAGSLIRLVERVPRYRAILELAVHSRREALSQRFSWLEPEEYVYHLTRQHPLYLAMHLIYPGLAALSSILFFLGAAEFQQPMLFVPGLFVIVLAVLWGVWFYLDYYNDYYIITNQRVVWIEKIIGIYDSRQEAPMTAIRTVDFSSRWLERLFGMGDLTVRTFTGSITLSNVRYAQFITDLLEEQRDRAKKAQISLKQESVRQIIREEIGLDRRSTAETREPQVSTPQHRKRWQLSFRTRLEHGSTITYRKHWVILVSKTLLPTLTLLASLSLFVMAGMGTQGIAGSAAAGLTLAALTGVLAAGLWMVYHYIDWRNDIYMITGDQIVDIERRPLGKEQRKAAALDNILSLSVERKNIIGIVLNYGDVIIDAGGTHLDFKNISDPTTAQLDISRHIEALRRRKDDAQFQDENRRLAEWLRTYHRETHD